MNSIFFLLILLLSLANHTYGIFGSRTKGQTRPDATKTCCFPPKINVDSRRANSGKDLLQQLIVDSDLYEEVTPDKMCDLMHFLFQQASLNKKSVDFTEGMFILFDSSKRLFDRLIKSKKSQQPFKPFHLRKHLPRINPIRYVRRRSAVATLVNPDTQKQANGFLNDQNQVNSVLDDQYPTYGMDIPDSCLPSNYDHIILGELPPVTNDDKYSGRRLFIKPERFGFEKTKISSALNNLNSFVKQLVKQEFCRLTKGETKAECAKLRAFKENVDKIIHKKWKKILSGLPSKWKIDRSYQARAMKYGIREIDRQSKDLEAAGAGKNVKALRQLLIKKYGNEDLRVRKGREILFTINELQQSHSTCETPNDIKCVSKSYSRFFFKRN